MSPLAASLLIITALVALIFLTGWVLYMIRELVRHHAHRLPAITETQAQENCRPMSEVHVLSRNHRGAA